MEVIMKNGINQDIHARIFRSLLTKCRYKLILLSKRVEVVHSLLVFGILSALFSVAGTSVVYASYWKTDWGYPGSTAYESAKNYCTQHPYIQNKPIPLFTNSVTNYDLTASFYCSSSEGWKVGPWDVKHYCDGLGNVLYSVGGCPEDVAANKGKGAPIRCVANPINIANGNKFQEEVDVSTGSMLPNFIRYYNASEVQDTGLGYGWTSNTIRHRLVIRSNVILHIGADGKGTYFRKAGENWVGDPDIDVTLTELIDRYEVYLPNNDVEQFDVDGRLLVERDIAGSTISYEYDANDHIVRITSSFGRAINFQYDTDDHLAQVKDSKGGIYQYAYSSNGNLSTVTYPDGRKRFYHYGYTNYPHALTGITDENNNRYATWTYDEEGRAISSEHANGVDKTTLTYNADGTTTVTNPLGKQTTYHFTTIHGVKKVIQVEGHPTTSCEGANKSYSYDANGNIASKTDWNGVTTTYTYDMNRNLELTRTEAAGTSQERTITTEWHSQFRLPTKITEPGKITEYSYDTQGRQLSSKVSSVQ